MQKKLWFSSLVDLLNIIGIDPKNEQSIPSNRKCN